MSHSFYLDNVKSLGASKVFQETGYGDIRFVDGYPAASNDEWPEGYTYLYRDKVSARAIEIDYNGSSLKIRVFAASSPQDYQLALKLTAAVAKLYGVKIQPEDNDEMDVDQFHQEYGKEWMENHCKQCLSAVLGQHVKHPDSTGSITGVGKTMTIGKRFMEQLMRSGRIDAKDFFFRLKKLNYIDDEDIYQATIFVLANDEDTKNVRITTYTEGVPTLFQEKNTVVSLCSDSYLSDSDESKKVVVPLLKLVEILGDEAVWLSEDLVLTPSIEGENWQKLIEKVSEIAVEDIFEYGYDPKNDPFADSESTASVSENDKSDLTSEELDVLAYAPIAVFFAVAAADGSIDKKEIKAFQKELLKGVLTESQLLQGVMIRVIAEFDSMVGSILGNKVDVQEKFGEILHILNNRIDAGEALKFKVSLLSLGKNVAEASGGFLGIFGSKISKEEKQALLGLAALLGVSG